MANMTSRLSITNAALSYLNQRPVQKVDERPESLAVNSIYDKIVGSRLRSFDWKFATKVSRLVPKKDADGNEVRSHYNYAYSVYEKPANLIRTINLFSDGTVDSPVKYELDRDGFHTTSYLTYALFARYVSNIDEAEWAPDFVSMVELSLAAQLSHLYAADNVRVIFDKYTVAEKVARAADGAESGGNDVLGTPDYFTRNLGGPGGSAVTNPQMYGDDAYTADNDLNSVTYLKI